MDQGLVGGRYRLDERLGVGGMAEVWAAEDVELGRRVALKLLAADADPARFEREAQAVAALAHPNICQLYDYGSAEERPFMVLEYLGGGSLEDRLVPGEPYPDDETVRIASEVASGLAHAHARGLVHRDLKPANILFDDEGRPKIADFGIARLGGAGTLTEAGTMLGTAAYISPEQAQGLAATAASDVYSFGVILYRLLSGRLPFESESAVELASMHVNERPQPVGELRGDVPPALAALADAALEKDPAARLRDGAALVEALVGSAPTISGAPTVVAGTAPTLVLARRDRRRAATQWRSALPIAIVAVALLAVGGAAIAILASRDSSSSNEPTLPPPAARQVKTPTTQTQPTTPAPAASTASPTTRRSPSTRATTTVPTAAPPPPPPPPPTTTTPPPPPTTVPTTTTLPVTTTTPPPPPPPP